MGKMIFHLIEIFLLLLIYQELTGKTVDIPTDWWQLTLLVIFAFFIILIEHDFYHTNVDYNKIREIIAEELKNEHDEIEM